MKKIFIIQILMLTVLQIFSQNIESIISQVTTNNPTLKTLSKSNSADSAGNKSGIYLQNPEVGFNYLSGNPSTIGNRKDFSIMQTFDFPTAYIYKSQISEKKNEQLQYAYESQYRSIVLQTKLVCIDLIFYNLLIKEYTKRLENAQQIAASYKLKFDVGEANILEYNKAELNKLNTALELEKLQAEKNALLNQLIGLNGNIAITFDDTIFFESQIPEDFEQWYAEAESRNPVLRWMKLGIEITEKQENLNLAMSLPKFKTGYMSEFTTGESFQGVSVGISIPLWENKNKYKYARLNTEAMQNYEIENRLSYYSTLKILHTKAVSLQKSVNEYESQIQSFSNSDLLYRAFEKGEIDLIDYIRELSFYFESTQKLLELKTDLQKVMAELNKY